MRHLCQLIYSHGMDETGAHFGGAIAKDPLRDKCRDLWTRWALIAFAVEPIREGRQMPDG